MARGCKNARETSSTDVAAYLNYTRAPVSNSNVYFNVCWAGVQAEAHLMQHRKHDRAIDSSLGLHFRWLQRGVRRAPHYTNDILV